MRLLYAEPTSFYQLQVSKKHQLTADAFLVELAGTAPASDW